MSISFGLNALIVSEMAALTGHLTDPQQSHLGHIKADPTLSTLVPHVETAHAVVVEAQSAAGPTAELQALFAAEETVDYVHDELAKAVLNGCEAAIHSEQAHEPNVDHTFINAVVAARDALFPLGVSHVNESYLSESGYATRAKQALVDKPEFKTTLAAIGIGRKTALALVEEWIAAGAELGKLETKRAEAGKRDKPNLTAARRAWLREMNLFTANAASGGSEHRAAILGVITEAVKKARARAADARRANAEKAKKEKEEAAKPVVPPKADDEKPKG